MMKSFATILLKPDTLSRNLCGLILDRIESAGLKLERIKTVKATKDRLESHYSEHKEKEFYPNLILSMIGKKVFAVHVSSEKRPAFALGREAVAAIREEFSHVVHGPFNLIHCSDSSDAGAREFVIWFIKG